MRRTIGAVLGLMAMAMTAPAMAAPGDRHMAREHLDINGSGKAVTSGTGGTGTGSTGGTGGTGTGGGSGTTPTPDLDPSNGKAVYASLVDGYWDYPVGSPYRDDYTKYTVCPPGTSYVGEYVEAGIEEESYCNQPALPTVEAEYAAFIMQWVGPFGYARNGTNLICPAGSTRFGTVITEGSAWEACNDGPPPGAICAAYSGPTGECTATRWNYGGINQCGCTCVIRDYIGNEKTLNFTNPQEAAQHFAIEQQYGLRCVR